MFRQTLHRLRDPGFHIRKEQTVGIVEPVFQPFVNELLKGLLVASVANGIETAVADGNEKV